MKYFYGWFICPEPNTDNGYYHSLEWCRRQFGEPNCNDRWFYESSSDQYYFRNEADATWFTLRWT